MPRLIREIFGEEAYYRLPSFRRAEESRQRAHLRIPTFAGAAHRNRF